MIKKKCPECGEKIELNYWNHIWHSRTITCENCTSVFFFNSWFGYTLILILCSLPIFLGYEFLNTNYLRLPPFQDRLVYMLIGAIAAMTGYTFLGKLINPIWIDRKAWWAPIFKGQIASIIFIVALMTAMAFNQMYLLIPLFIYFIGTEWSTHRHNKIAKKSKRIRLAACSISFYYSEVEPDIVEIITQIDKAQYAEAIGIADQLYKRAPNNFYTRTYLSYCYEIEDYKSGNKTKLSEELIEIARDLFLRTRPVSNHYFGWLAALDYYLCTYQFRKIYLLSSYTSDTHEKKYLMGISLGHFYLNNKQHPKASKIRRKALKLLKGYFGDQDKNQYAWKLRDQIKKAT